MERLADRILQARDRARGELLASLGPEGHWEGRLSSSALSTATAVIALRTIDPRRHERLIADGLAWLARHAHADGGWGDTPESRSNLSTTALGWAAFGAVGADAQFPETIRACEHRLAETAGSLEELAPAIERRYGKDRTFSVPILMTLALSGRLGPNGWSRVRPLPFELSVLPRGLFGALRLPVVSYALPALIAIGQVVYHFQGRFLPQRHWTRRRSLKILATLQPENGGFLEAVPLTSFVTMSLAAMGAGENSVAQLGAEFLRKSARPDGSWPIDTHLATWVTTLSIKALHPVASARLRRQRGNLLRWLLAQQHRRVHPYTGAAPGGWAWTPLPGGVPDADDTAGALVALRLLEDGEPGRDTLEAASAGVQWLLNLQNRDGGIPTFCRGWGALPFDRSAPELTAHALRAWAAWERHLDPKLRQRVSRGARRGLRFLETSQQPDGAWIPLWFGNEATGDEENPVYGTAQVLASLHALPDVSAQSPMIERAVQFLLSQQNPDGGWGGARGVPSSVEETALALEALSGLGAGHEALASGAAWLASAIEAGGLNSPSPIGLYFARLWYSERLYPLIFATAALNRLCALTAPPNRRVSPAGGAAS